MHGCRERPQAHLLDQLAGWEGYEHIAVRLICYALLASAVVILVEKNTKQNTRRHNALTRAFCSFPATVQE